MKASDAAVGAVVAQGATAAILVQVLVFHAFVIRARLASGYWPYPYHPDPADLGFSVHHAVTWLGFILVAAVAPALCAVCFFAARELGTSRAIRIASVAVFAFTYLAGFLFLGEDPWHFGEWFVD